MKPQVIQVFADGGVIETNPSPIGGTFACCHINGAGEQIYINSGLILPEPWGLGAVSNNISECLAIYYALLPLPDRWTGTVFSDSKIALGRFFHSFRWNNVPAEMIEMCMTNRRRLGEITTVLLDGHPTRAQLEAGIGKRGHPVSKWNVWCDQECGRVARRHRASLAQLAETQQEAA